MNRSEFAKCIGALQAGIGRDMGRAQIEIWYGCLSDLPTTSLEYAVKRWLCETDSSWPTIAAIRKFAAEHQSGEPMDAGEAWALVLRAVRAFGFYRPVEGRAALDEITAAAVEGVGGWNLICNAPPDEMGNYHARFRDVYARLSARAERDKRLPQALVPGRRIEAEQKALPEVKALADSFPSVETERRP